MASGHDCDAGLLFGQVRTDELCLFFTGLSYIGEPSIYTCTLYHLVPLPGKIESILYIYIYMRTHVGNPPDTWSVVHPCMRSRRMRSPSGQGPEIPPSRDAQAERVGPELILSGMDLDPRAFESVDSIDRFQIVGHICSPFLVR